MRLATAFTGASEPAGNDVLSSMVVAALELVDHDGIRAVTVRNLARRTYYSPSSIGYHVSPVNRFHTLLWERVGAELLDDVVQLDLGTPGRAVVAARRLVARCDDQRRRAEFFARFYPESEQSSCDGRLFRSLLGAFGAPADDAVYLARRAQILVDLAVSAPDLDGAVDRVELELRDLLERRGRASSAASVPILATRT